MIRKEGFLLSALTSEERITLFLDIKLGKELLGDNPFRNLLDIICIILDKKINEVGGSFSSSHDIPLESDDYTPNQWFFFRIIAFL